MREPSERPPWALPGWDDVPPVASAGPAAAPGTFGVRIHRVTELAKTIRAAVRADERLRDVWVEGEVGRVTVSSAGHAYFSLKDERSQLQCVMFRDDFSRSGVEPRAGLRIVVNGRVDMFEAQGALQLYVAAIQPAGFGDLALRFEALKAKLSAEGLFDASRKRPLPRWPRTIAVITSPTGVVWRDVCTVLTRRWPLANVLLVACRVQGDGAPDSIVNAFRRLERWSAAAERDGRADDLPDVSILARGGGSLEDLWSFNDERVVRAVVGHPIPVVCGVGHEVDVTLADFAADVRAPTPSAAAEMVVPDGTELRAQLDRARARSTAATGRTLGAAATRLAQERRALARLDPIASLAAARERTGLLFDRVTRALDTRLARAERGTDALRGRLDGALPTRLLGSRHALGAAAAALNALGPQATLDRGYAIVRRRGDGTIVRDPGQAPAGTALALRVAGGELEATADGP
jgi:exodeoxyribonuclease VII large subunit